MYLLGYLLQHLSSALLAVGNGEEQISSSQNATGDVGRSPGDIEADLGVDDVSRGDEGIESAGDQGDPAERYGLRYWLANRCRS